MGHRLPGWSTRVPWRRSLAVMVLTCPVIIPPSAASQRVATRIDVGGVALRYADTVSAAAASLSPGLSLTWPRATLDVAGTLSGFDSGDWAAQGSLAAAAVVPATRWLTAEIGGTAGGSAHQDGAGTGQALASGRAHFATRKAGLWIGAGVGSVWDGELTRGLRHAEAGSWLRVARLTALATVSPTAVGDSIRYADAQLFLRWDLGNVELGGSAGWRSGRRLPSYGGGGTSWASLNATFWLASRVGIVAGAGSYPVDLTQGFPGGRYASVGLRLATRTRSPESSWAGRRVREQVEATTRAGVTRFAVSGSGGETRTLRVHAPAARTVEIAGDFTRWVAVALRSEDDGWWSLTFPIPSGAHQVAVRIDGGAWLVPPGLLPIVDEFGGAAGVVVIQ